MSKYTPSRYSFGTVTEAARRRGYLLIVTSGKTWLIKGLSWRCLRTEDVAAFLCPAREQNAEEDAAKAKKRTEIVDFRPQ